MNQFVSEKVLDETIINELLYRNQVEKDIKYQVEEIYDKLYDELERLFVKGIRANNLLADVESLYTFYLDMGDKCRRFLGIYREEQAQLSGHPQYPMIEKIALIFEEYLTGLLDLHENQGIKERDRYIKKCRDRMRQIYESLKEGFEETRFGHVFEQEEAYEGVKATMDRDIQVMVKNMLTTMDQCFTHINTVEKRPVLTKYVGFLFQQDQTMALLNVLKISQTDGLAYEDQIVQKLSDIAKDMYHQLGQKIQVIHKALGQKVPGQVDEATIMALSKQLLKDGLTRLQVPAYYKAIESYLHHKKDIMKSLYIGVTDEVDKARTMSVNQLEKASKTIQLVSCNLVELAKSCHMELQAIKDQIPSEMKERQILLGIIETMALKAEVLKDMDYQFMLERTSDLIEMEKALYAFNEALKDMFDDYFKQLLLDAEKSFYKIEKKYADLSEDKSRALMKKDVGYLKNHLLFEVVTYEDLIHQSLPKLEDKPDPLIRQVVEVVQTTFDQMQSLLERFGILAIMAETGSRFNGKEHEVTVTQPHETYRRGQIIEMISRGYRYKGVVVQRAHVIVAQ